MPMATAEYKATRGSWARNPLTNEMSMQTGATMDHSTTCREVRMRRRAEGSSMAARTCGASTARTLVAGTSEYIQLDRTKAKARLPWSSKSWFTRSGGRKNQAELIRAALRATVMKVSK